MNAWAILEIKKKYHTQYYWLFAPSTSARMSRSTNIHQDVMKSHNNQFEIRHIYSLVNFVPVDECYPLSRLWHNHIESLQRLRDKDENKMIISLNNVFMLCIFPSLTTHTPLRVNERLNQTYVPCSRTEFWWIYVCKTRLNWMFPFIYILQGKNMCVVKFLPTNFVYLQAILQQQYTHDFPTGFGVHCSINIQLLAAFISSFLLLCLHPFSQQNWAIKDEIFPPSSLLCLCLLATAAYRYSLIMKGGRTLYTIEYAKWNFNTFDFFHLIAFISCLRCRYLSRLCSPFIAIFCVFTLDFFSTHFIVVLFLL